MSFFIIFLCELALLFVSSRFLTRSLTRLFFFLTRSETITIQLLALLFLPGVIIHELSHFLMASILFVPTGEIEFMPQIREGRVKLGSVQIAKTDFLRRALIGLAPIVFGGSILLGILFFFGANIFFHEKAPLWQYLVALYAVFEIGNTMFSSKKDVEGLLELFVGIFAILVLLFIMGVHIPEWLVTFVNSAAFETFFKNAGILFLLPLGINALIIGGVRFLKR